MMIKTESKTWITFLNKAEDESKHRETAYAVLDFKDIVRRFN
jgi:hypothetical protein